VLFNVRGLDIRGAAMIYLATTNTGHGIWYMLIQKNTYDMVHCQRHMIHTWGLIVLMGGMELWNNDRNRCDKLLYDRDGR